MPIEDKRRRLSGEATTTTQLSVAELIARREAETQPIPVITDEGPAEPTIRFAPVKKKNQPARELHIADLLRREGRADDTDAGGFAMGKLVAAASGGVVLCGSMAFGASQWLSGPDERPLAEVRFDERAQARGATGNGVVKLPAPPQTEIPGTETAEATEEVKPRVAPYTQQQQRPQTQTQTPEQQQTVTPPAESTTTPPSSESTTTPPPSSTTTPAPPPSESSTPPSETTSPSPSTGVSIGVDLGILDPLGNFDFFAPAK